MGLSIFNERSNADGDMVDWFLTRWAEQERDALQSNTQRRWWVAGAVLSHPRARATTLERLYVRYGTVNWWLCLMVAKAPSCPDWVRQDAIRYLARDGLAGRVEVDYLSASPECARLLYGFGRLDAAADCENAHGDLLVDVLEAKLREAPEVKGDSANNVPRFKANDAIVTLSHDNMPLEVRRECARWLPGVLWLVARDGFWEGCERRAATARGRVPDVLSLLSPRPTSLCCALAFPVSFLHAWRVSLSTHLSRMVGWRRVLLVFPGGLVAWRRVRDGLLCVADTLL